jgi:O-6-methylguanine DNA methyltransferase
MSREKYSGLAEARQLVVALRSLKRAPAAPALLPAVLSALELADAYLQLASPIGPVFVAFNGCGITALGQAEDAAAFEQAFRTRFGRRLYRIERSAAPAWLQYAEAVLLRGEQRNLPFDLRRLPAFERAVLQQALTIPYGEVRPYSWIAREIGRPRAVRAVGMALAHNPIPLLIPCHRVVRSDCQIGNYSLGGPAQKRALLEAEGVDVALLERLARRGIRYIGDSHTRSYCFPTCRYVREIAQQHRVPLRSEQEAAHLGYRPCRNCRPSAVLSSG